MAVVTVRITNFNCMKGLILKYSIISRMERIGIFASLVMPWPKEDSEISESASIVGCHR